MDFNAIQSLIADDLKAVNALIQARLRSDVVLINQLAGYIINSGGKRLRPMLVLLTGRANGFNPQAHALMAAVIEFIHTATLLHDDVVDDSDMRRGRETDRKSTRLNSSHVKISYAVFCLKKKKHNTSHNKKSYEVCRVR